MKTKGIVMTTESIAGINSGIIPQTRRILKPQPDNEGFLTSDSGRKLHIDELGLVLCRYEVGDILYVKETWSFWPCWNCEGENCNTPSIVYKDEIGCFVRKADGIYEPHDDKWKPSIHMPKEAARIFLKVIAVKVERIQGIGIHGILAEGIDIGSHCRKCIDNYVRPNCADDESECGVFDGICNEFANWWNNTHGKGAWERNDWVAAYTFERCEKLEG